VWLEEHLSCYSKCLLVISHSQDFLNAVCTNTVWLKPNAMGKAGSQLCYYGGNYDAFMQVTSEEARVQESVTHKEQEE
jgi:ATP-binding cassette subfamily F protein 2